MKKTITISLKCEDLRELQEFKKSSLGDDHAEFVVESSEISVSPGAAETIGVLAIVISFVSGVASQVLGAWIYDKIKGKTKDPKFEIYIEGVKIDTQNNLEEDIKNQLTQKR